MSHSQRQIDDRYELLDALTTNDAGTVWRCRDVHSGSEHAITLLRPRRNRQDEALAALVPVLNGIEQLAHPHIVVAEEVVAGEDWIVVVTQPIPADDLHSLLELHGPMPPVQAAHLGAQLCEALAAAHEIGVPHGHLIPNVVLFEPGDGGPWTVRLNGFGMAALLPLVVPPDVDAPILAARYRAPELADDESVSTAGDVYAVGVLLYEALTGSPPLIGIDPAEVVAAEQTSVDPLWRLIAACVDGNPHDRPDAAWLAERFGGLRAPVPAVAPTPTGALVVANHRHVAPKPSRLKRLRRSRLIEIGAAVTVGVLTAVTITLLAAGAGPHSGTTTGQVNPIVPIATGEQAFTETPTPATSTGPGTSPGARLSATPSAPAVTSTGLSGASSTATPSTGSTTVPTRGNGASGRLANARSGKCLDTSGGYFANAVVEQIWTCDSGVGQVVTWAASGQLTEDGGAYCFDDTGGSAAAGTKVELFACRAGTDQQWTIRSDGSIANNATGLCVDVAAPGTDNGNQVELQPCDGQASQHWAWN